MRGSRRFAGAGGLRRNVRGGGRRAWTPKRLDPIIWLRADTGITTAGSGISEWLCKAGTGRKMTQSTDAARPQFNASGIGGQPTVDGDGANYYMATAATFPAVSELTVLVVQRIVAATNFGMTFVQEQSDTELRQDGTTGKPEHILGASAGVVATDSGVGNNESIVVTRSTAGDGTLYIDGAQEDTESLANSNVSSDTGSILARSSGSSKANLRLAEVVYVPRASTAAERADWDSYVASRYGI